MAGVRALGEDVDEDEAVPGLDQVVDRPPRGGLAGRRVVHAHANGALLGCHARRTCCGVLRCTKAVKRKVVVQEGRGAEAAIYIGVFLGRVRVLF